MMETIENISSICFILKKENNQLISFNGQSICLRLSIKGIKLNIYLQLYGCFYKYMSIYTYLKICFYVPIVIFVFILYNINIPTDDSIIKRDFSKLYHQQGASFNDSDQNVEFLFVGNNTYHQIGNSYVEFDITVCRADNANFTDNRALRLVNHSFSFCFNEAPLSTTSGRDLEHNKFVGQVSTIKRAITSRDGDLLSHFDRNNEETGACTVTADNIKCTSLKEMLIGNHTEVANRSKTRGQLPLEHIFCFCKTSRKINKNFGISYHVQNS